MNNWRILIVDDDQELGAQLKDYFDGETLGDPPIGCTVEVETDFGKAVEALEASRIDFLILDLQGSAEGEAEVGRAVLEEIKHRRFVPLVFYTGHPTKVEDLATPLVRVVVKTHGAREVFEQIKGIFDTGIPSLNRAIIRHVEDQQRSYMWEFVAGHWEELGTSADRASLAYMLARRLALSLSGSGIERFIDALGGSAEIGDSKVHPMQYYVFPPLAVPPALAGDIFKKNDSDDYAVLLTPSCDLAQSKTDWVLMANCVPLTETKEFKEWTEAHQATANEKDVAALEGKLTSLIRNNRQGKGVQPKRYYFLPGALHIPHLVIDFQQLFTLEQKVLEGNNPEYVRIASLDSPFAEAVLAQFSQFFGRLGTPDLDAAYVISYLKNGNK